MGARTTTSVRLVSKVISCTQLVKTFGPTRALDELDLGVLAVACW